MKITLRLIVSLVLVAALVAAVFSYLQVDAEKKRLTKELDVRAVILSESLEESVKALLRTSSTAKLKQLVERFGNRDRLIGIAVYDTQGVSIATSPKLSSAVQTPPPEVWESLTSGESVSGFDQVLGKKTRTLAVPLSLEEGAVGALLLLYDASYIDARLEGIWQANFVSLLTLSFLIILTTVIVVRWSITGPIAQIAEWMRRLRMGETKNLMNLPRGDILGPLATEVTLLAKNLALTRAAAEEKARQRVEAESLWTAERLKEQVRRELGEKNLVVVSNREPYMHVKQGSSIECIVPAGGLVTAMDPILRACGGIWVAHGSGDADREMINERDTLRVPPDEPAYSLKRVFLTKEEEEGYYYGFSNEGIWPLCHITHTRPVFRLNDWIHYQRVNERFAQALFEEIEHEEEPLILVQDYHFALLPLLIKSKRPDARVAIFWHIPWPNPEVFGICPRKQEILLGLLGADLIGFQIQFHCNNFLDTVDRFLESKINWEQFSVERRGSVTRVRPFPISVAFGDVTSHPPTLSTRETLLKKIGVSAKYLGVGVDRIDYTKGILERFKAVERFLEKYPDFIGQFSFVELGAPSRTHIKRYHDLTAELDETVDKINWRFRTKNWRPIVFLKAHHSHEVINQFYEVADICAVTSLHDGMNLVAKEFVSNRDDESGVLILSQFTGAARELHDALIVNPYDIEELAEAFHTGLTMDPKEKRDRMKGLRAVVKERNVYRWAANIVSTLSHLPLPKQAPEQVA